MILDRGDSFVEYFDKSGRTEPASPTPGTDPVEVERRIELRGNRVEVYFEFNPKLNEALRKSVMSARWNGKVWTVATREADLRALAAFMQEHGFAKAPEDIRQKFIELQGIAKETREASRAMTPKNLQGLDGLTLLPYQVAAVEYAKRVYRPKGGILLADEMGLGKTPETLAILQYFGMWPAVVVCPAFLKLNWKRECNRWLPHVPVEVIEDGAHVPGTIEGLYIVSYDIVAKVVDRLRAKKIQAVAVDEAHYIANGRAKRSLAVRKLCRGVPLRIVITGTPLVNAPRDLINLLATIQRLDDFGGFWKFAERYCGAIVKRLPTRGRRGEKWGDVQCNAGLHYIGSLKKTIEELTFEEKERLATYPGWGWDMRGATNLPELNRKLREICMIRRRKDEVLQELPEKRRVIVPIELDNLQEYQEAKEDVVKWIAEKASKDPAFRALISCMDEEAQFAMLCKRASDAAEKAELAPELVKMAALSRIAARGKLKAIKEWCENFTGTGENLIVGAMHTEIVDSLGEHFTVPVIKGGMTMDRRDAIVTDFQNGGGLYDNPDKGRLLPGNIKAMGVGLTLTAAHNAAVAEMGWTAAVMDQFEDRTHRYGQKNAVTIWYFLAKGTVDWQRWEVVNEKRAIGREAVG